MIVYLEQPGHHIEGRDMTQERKTLKGLGFERLLFATLGNVEAEKGISFYSPVPSSSLLTETRQNNVFYCWCVAQFKSTWWEQSFIKNSLCIGPSCQSPGLSPARIPAPAT